MNQQQINFRTIPLTDEMRAAERKREVSHENRRADVQRQSDHVGLIADDPAYFLGLVKK